MTIITTWQIDYHSDGSKSTLLLNSNPECVFELKISFGGIIITFINLFNKCLRCEKNVKKTGRIVSIMFQYQAFPPSFIIAELVFQVCRSGKVTMNHRQQLRSVLLENTLSEEDYSAIDRLLYAIRRGWLQLAE